MEQYYRLFSSYREPGRDKDRLLTTEGHNSEDKSDHIIVICKNKVSYSYIFIINPMLSSYPYLDIGFVSIHTNSLFHFVKN